MQQSKGSIKISLKNLFFVTLNSFQGLLMHRFCEMLKQVQHDILPYFGTFPELSKNT